MWLPEMPLVDQFRQLALAAMDATKQAGADFADMRIGVQRDISVGSLPSTPTVRMSVSYGIRARVQGTWGFERGSTLSVDAVTRAARSAVVGATRYAAANGRLGRRPVAALAAAPVVTGEWRGPCVIGTNRIRVCAVVRAVAHRTDDRATVDGGGIQFYRVG